MSKKYNLSKVSNLFLTIKNIVGLLFLIGLPAYYIYIIRYNVIRNKALQGAKKQCKAVVIDKKNFFGNSPVSGQFSYSYRFSVSGKTYEGDTRESNLRVGDSLIVRYVSEKPEYNEPLN
jgi:hypothetical protein